MLPVHSSYALQQAMMLNAVPRRYGSCMYAGRYSRMTYLILETILCRHEL